MLHPSTQKLIDRLSEMTGRGKIAWEDADNGALNYVTEGYSVQVTAEPNELIIISKEGAELERAAAAALLATPSDIGTYADTLAAMTEEARRIAKGTESAIGALLADMDEAEAPPAEEIERQETELAQTAAEETTDETALIAGEEIETVEAQTPEPTLDSISSEEEPDVTAAVARLADEVNGRDGSQPAEPEGITNGALSAAASGLAASVAMAELSPAADTTETADVPAEAETDVETDEIVPPAASTMVTSAAIENHTYVPFGLEAAPDVTELPAAAIVDSVPAVDIEPSPEPEVTETVETANDTVGLDLTSPEVTDVVPEESASDLSAPATSWASTTFMVADKADDAEATPEDETPAIEAASTVAEPEVSAEPETQPETVEETVIAAPIEAPADPLPNEMPTSFSLSGIGAGFGLGALTAKTEASGTPSANAGSAPAEKVVIDATDDMPFVTADEIEEPVEVPPLPDAATIDPTPVVQATGEPEPEATGEAPAEAEEPREPKPRTRFNPWN